MSEHAPPEADAAEAEPVEEQSPVTTGAQSVVRALENAGAEYIFGVQGGAIMPVYDALYDSDINHVTMAHEQGPPTLSVSSAAAPGSASPRPVRARRTSSPASPMPTWTRTR